MITVGILGDKLIAWLRLVHRKSGQARYTADAVYAQRDTINAEVKLTLKKNRPNSYKQ